MKWINMMRPVTLAGILCCFSCSYHCACATDAEPRVIVNQQAQPRFRPIGSPSAVDSFAPSRFPVRQVAMMQINGDNRTMPAPALPQGGYAFPNPPLTQGVPFQQSSPAQGGYALPQAGALPVPLQSAPVGPISPPTTNSLPLNPNSQFTPSPFAPRAVPQAGLPINPNVVPGNSPLPGSVLGGQSIPVPRTAFPQGQFGPGATVPLRSNDYVAIPQPQLENSFATIDNCRNISGPSTYRAAGVFGCGTPVYAQPTYSVPAAYIPPPSQISPAVALPPNATFAPVGFAGSVPPVLPGSPGYRPLISFGQGANPVQVGQGIIGQPVAYVPGQFFRNALRYNSF